MQLPQRDPIQGEEEGPVSLSWSPLSATRLLPLYQYWFIRFIPPLHLHINSTPYLNLVPASLQSTQAVCHPASQNPCLEPNPDMICYFHLLFFPSRFSSERWESYREMQDKNVSLWGSWAELIETVVLSLSNWFWKLTSSRGKREAVGRQQMTGLFQVHQLPPWSWAKPWRRQNLFMESFNLTLNFLSCFSLSNVPLAMQ